MEDTDPIVLRARLAQTEQALERSERLGVASRFAGAVMHEVNNPLEAITNLVYLTKLQADDSAQVLENMRTIEEQLAMVSRVTSQALTFHRDRSEPGKFDLVEIANSALKLHHDKLSRHGITVQRRFRGAAFAKIQGSEILQVISNLILNAIDVLPRGRGRLCIGVGTHRDRVSVTVHDDGPGVPEPLEQRLFEPYITGKESGTGLGLWLSRRIVQRHRGTLRFRTSRREGRSGTCFRISLPTGQVAY